MVDVSIYPGVGNNYYSALARVKVNSELVLTTSQLAEFYETDQKIIRKNFERNQEHFKNGKHFFKLECEDLKDFKAILQNEGYNFKNSTQNCTRQNDVLNSKNPAMIRALYLWTKRGVARHAKILGSNKAWEVFDLLEENYFNSLTSKPTFDDNEKFKIKMLTKLSSLTKDKKLREQLIAETATIITGKKFTVSEPAESLKFIEKFIEENCIFNAKGKIMRKDFIQRLQMNFPDSAKIPKNKIVHKVISIEGIKNKMIGGTGANGFTGISWKN